MNCIVSSSATEDHAGGILASFVLVFHLEIYRYYILNIARYNYITDTDTISHVPFSSPDIPLIHSSKAGFENPVMLLKEFQHVAGSYSTYSTEKNLIRKKSGLYAPQNLKVWENLAQGRKG